MDVTKWYQAIYFANLRHVLVARAINANSARNIVRTRARASASACETIVELSAILTLPKDFSLSGKNIYTDCRLHACACRFDTHGDGDKRQATTTTTTQHFTNSKLAISSDTRVSLRGTHVEGWIRPRQCPGFTHLPATSAATKSGTVFTRRIVILL